MYLTPANRLHVFMETIAEQLHPVLRDRALDRICRQPACPETVLATTLDFLDAVAAGHSADYALCTCLAGRFRADAVVQVVLGPHPGAARVTAWPDTLDVTGLRAAVERLPQWRDRPTTLMLRQALGCVDLARLTIESPLEQVRLVLLAAGETFDPIDLHVLGCLREPFGRLLQVVEHESAEPAAYDGCTFDPGLSARETQVLGMVAQGLLARTVAARLQVSTRTVHKHLGSAYRKLDAHDRLAAVRRAERLGLLSGGCPTAAPTERILEWTVRW